MRKLTRRFKKYRKNQTIKRGGDSNTESSNKESSNNDEGVVDIVTDKLYDVGSSIASGTLDAGLKLAGLERVNKSEENEETQKVDQNIGQISDTESGIVSDVGNVVDKTGATIIENVNDVLGSSVVQETTAQAAENTAEIVKETTKNFNEALNNPEVKEEVIEAIDKASEIATIGAKAIKEPLNEVLDETAESLNDAAPKFGKAAANALNATLEEVPVIGNIYGALNILNNLTKAASAGVAVGTKLTKATSDAIIDTTDNYQKEMKEFEEKKKEADNIENRTKQSYNEFQNPLPQTAQVSKFVGGRKTRRSRLTKRKAKSKRVRFAI